jgi:deoxycytidine triphosphate deaminase
MTILDGLSIAAFLDKYIDKEKQSGPHSFDLTAKSITQLEGIGRVDFSGKEFEWGQRSIISPKSFKPGESLGWWKLPQGEYIVRFNEAITLPDNSVAIVYPHDRISQNGAHHIPINIQSSTAFIEVLLVVGRQGIEIKENARISYVMVFQL